MFYLTGPDLVVVHLAILGIAKQHITPGNVMFSTSETGLDIGVTLQPQGTKWLNLLLDKLGDLTLWDPWFSIISVLSPRTGCTAVVLRNTKYLHMIHI